MTDAAKKHLPPAYEARVQSDASDGWKTIGQAWKTNREGVLSVKLTEPSDSFILVVKKASKPKTAQPA